ncbi:MAG: hypothetical protein IPO67_11015 [Deltaproteobacteria bacterium]|nr:hypothetical protein [Deltaproteobacteria bacterium]
MLWTAVGVTAVCAAIIGLPFAAPKPLSASKPGLPRAALAFFAISALLYVNQVIFNAWMVLEHNADPAYLRQFVHSQHYFNLAPQHPPVAWLVAWAGDGEWMAPSFLRVQAVLELPWALTAYLMITALLHPPTARQIAAGPLGAFAAVSHTAVLCVVEVLLWNPWTEQDLALRVVGLVLTLPLLRWIGREPTAEAPPSAVQLVNFFVGLGAASALVLGGNLVALLYNLAWLDEVALILAAATLMLSLCLWVRSRPTPATDSALVTALHHVGARFTLTFAAPALAIRYGMTHSAAVTLAGIAAAVVILTALITGLSDAAAAQPPDRRGAFWVRAVLAVGLAAPAAVFDWLSPLGVPVGELPDAWLLVRLAQTLFAFSLGWGVGGVLRPFAPTPAK